MGGNTSSRPSSEDIYYDIYVQSHRRKSSIRHAHPPQERNCLVPSRQLIPQWRHQWLWFWFRLASTLPELRERMQRRYRYTGPTDAYIRLHIDNGINLFLAHSALPAGMHQSDIGYKVHPHLVYPLVDNKEEHRVTPVAEFWVKSPGFKKFRSHVCIEMDLSDVVFDEGSLKVYYGDTLDAKPFQTAEYVPSEHASETLFLPDVYFDQVRGKVLIFTLHFTVFFLHKLWKPKETAQHRTGSFVFWLI